MFTVIRRRAAALKWRMNKRADVRSLALHRANHLWASGQRVTRRTRRRLRKEARRDLTLLR